MTMAPAVSGRRFLSSAIAEMSMKMYLASLAAGILVGVIYSLVNVRSPAPPVVALIGLLGILAGEQIPPLVKSLLSKEPTVQSWLDHVKPHMFGHLPKGQTLRGESLAADRTAKPADEAEPRS
jgi:XapX domain-containing protein